ncbi:MAG: hypothetical protein OXD44_06785 [Gammaproteobacteria bacterium]|nr:hypothetical protein [Gammaproteobacteria bacterium]
MPLDDGAFSETGSAACTVHAMAGTPEAFCLTVQRKAVDRPGQEDPDRPVQAGVEMPGQEPYPVEEESDLNSRYICRAIATGLDGEGWSDAQIVWRHSQRADASENRSDFGGAHLPAALIPRSFRTRQGPAGNGHGFARPEFAMRPGTCPATAFRHGKRRCHAPHPALLTSPEHSGPASERIPACSGQKNFYLWIRGFTTA